MVLLLKHFYGDICQEVNKKEENSEDNIVSVIRLWIFIAQEKNLS